MLAASPARQATLGARRLDRLGGRVASVVPPLSLLPLTDAEYHDFAERQVAESARQRVEAGEWMLTDAHQRARAEQADLLADRLRNEGHTFLKGVHTADGMLVGWVWVGPGPAFLERYGVHDLTARVLVLEMCRRIRATGGGRCLMWKGRYILSEFDTCRIS